MATGRTINASFLTDFDKSIIEICNTISETIFKSIDNEKLKNEFNIFWGRVILSRENMEGNECGLLQKYAVYVDNDIFSNVRWHPLIIAKNKINFAKEIIDIDTIHIDSEFDFVNINNAIKIEYEGKIESYLFKNAYQLPDKFVITQNHSDKLFQQYSPAIFNYIINAENFCNWHDSVEIYAFMAISVAVNFYNVNFEKIYSEIISILKNQNISSSIQLPKNTFPQKKGDFVKCPVCKTALSNGISNLFGEKETYTISKIKPIYLNPLIKNEIRHNVANIRFGHSWCASILNNRSIEDTIFTLSDILKSHGKDLPLIVDENKELTFLSYQIDKSLQNVTIAIKQYFDYFSEYVRRIKGKEIFFYVKPNKNGFEFKVNPEDVEIVEKYLMEYSNLVNEKIENIVLNFENPTLLSSLKESSYIHLKQQIQGFQYSIELLSFEKNVIEKHNTELKEILKDLTEIIKEKSKQPIQIFNQSIPVTELKQLVLDIINEFKNINIQRITEEERIIDYYLKLDTIKISNKPDYEKRINQWLPEYSKLNNLSQTYLLSAEFLFDALFKADANDYSPFVLQYCRVLENELLKNLFVGFYNYIRNLKTDIQIQTDYSWDFVKTNKNSEFAKLFLRTEEPEIMLAKIITFLKNVDDANFASSLLINDFKNFIDTIFDKNKILEQSFINKIDFVRENYRNKAAHPDKNTIKLNLSEAQNCQIKVREILKIWLENKR